ncbi:hypothetical protein KUCAC02_005605 [Chaenocephalus aceratus]|uniref:Uncharacterized protein n=1 Tax=Chaenocephalus aceratus TaxID=36190 RepID=A0ACB9WQL3_CHAAC|nr:hypothetical protein KUCAC02_005605 [Chaenocephalus aceratus]
MSVPFSNTHLRVPRGFSTILEGLAREVLRDQPEDIPKYAAQYFDTLLTQREDSGIDPAEWAAKLEDRFYNNHAFKTTGPSPEKEPSAKMTISKEKSYESQTEDESSHTEGVSNVSTTHPTVSEEVDSSESTEEYEEKLDITEKNVISMAEGLSEEESVNMLPATDLQPDDLSGTEEEKDQTIFDQSLEEQREQWKEPLLKMMRKAQDPNLRRIHGVDGKHEGVKTISSSHQPTIDEENSENEMDHENEDINEKAGGISEGEFHQNEGCEKDENSNDAEDETTDTDGGKKEDGLAEGYGDGEIQETNAGGAGNHSSQVTQENISTAGIEAEREALEASTHLPEEKEESRSTPVDSQLQDTVGETEVTSTEKGKRDTLYEEGSSSPTPSADLPAVEDEVPLASEKDSTEPEGKSSVKEDCSRPHEEEDIMDIPLDDPEANRAAAKIQAGFRGHMTRKKMKPEDKAEGEEVSSTGDVLNCSQGDTETGGSRAVERDDTSVPEQ